MEEFNPVENLNKQLERALLDLNRLSNRVTLDIDLSQLEEIKNINKEIAKVDQDEELSPKERLTKRLELLNKIKEIEENAAIDRENILKDELQARKNEINVIIDQIDDSDQEQVALKEELKDDLVSIEQEITNLQQNELEKRLENEKINTEKSIELQKKRKRRNTSSFWSAGSTKC